MRRGKESEKKKASFRLTQNKNENCGVRRHRGRQEGYANHTKATKYDANTFGLNAYLQPAETRQATSRAGRIFTFAGRAVQEYRSVSVHSPGDGEGGKVKVASSGGPTGAAALTLTLLTSGAVSTCNTFGRQRWPQRGGGGRKWLSLWQSGLESGRKRLSLPPQPQIVHPCIF